jgi:hypothetical protein
MEETWQDKQHRQTRQGRRVGLTHAQLDILEDAARRKTTDRFKAPGEVATHWVKGTTLEILAEKGFIARRPEIAQSVFETVLREAVTVATTSLAAGRWQHALKALAHLDEVYEMSQRNVYFVTDEGLAILEKSEEGEE